VPFVRQCHQVAEVAEVHAPIIASLDRDALPLILRP